MTIPCTRPRVFGIFVFLALAAFCGQSALAQPSPTPTPLPNLILPAGTPRTIAAQRWEFGRVEIGEGATLTVTPGSTGVLHLVVRGTFTLKGTIIAEEFSSAEQQITLRVPGQQPVVVTYRNTNIGGIGGSGGNARAGNAGGAGANGAIDFGGGGGGGGCRFQSPDLRNWTGAPGQGERGGQRGPDCGMEGGSGGRRSNRGNGGVVHLEIYGDFDGGGGIIRVMGSQGTNGANGGAGSESNARSNGAGGGGGGAPGGQGGFLVAYIQGRVGDYPQVLTAGGEGGAGGTSPGHPSRLGTAGTLGQRGTSGSVFWFTPPLAP